MWQVAQGWAAAAAPRSAYTPKEQTVQAKRRATRHGHVGAKTTVHDDETEDGGPRLEVGRGSALLPPDEPMTVDAGESYDRKIEDLREEAVLHKARHVMAKKARGEELSSVDQDYFIMVAGENGLTRMRYKQLMGGAKLPPLSDITYEDIRGDTLGKAQGKKMYGKRQRNALEYCKNHKNGVFVAPKGRMTQKAEAKRARLAEAGDVKSLMKLLSAREEEAGMERRPGSLANELSNFETYRSFAMQMGRSPYMFDLAYAPTAKQIADWDGFMKLFVLFGSLHYVSHQALQNTVSAVRTVNMRVAGVVLPSFPRTTAAIKEVRTIMYNEAGERRERHGIMPQHFTAIAADWTATIKAARGGTPAQKSHAALLANALVLLAACKSKAFRPGEISPKLWDAIAYWSRASVKILQDLRDGGAECIKPPLALKNMPSADGHRRSVLARPWPYVYVKADPCCLPAAVKLQAEADPIEPSKAKSTPVVRDPATGGTLDVTQWGHMVQEAHRRLFPEEPTISVSAYSIKIGATLALKFVGATAEQRQLFAGWADDAIMNVYDDDERDEIVRLMTKASTQSFVGLAAAVGANASVAAPRPALMVEDENEDALTAALRAGWDKSQRRSNEAAQAESREVRQRAGIADPTNPRWAPAKLTKQISLAASFGNAKASQAVMEPAGPDTAHRGSMGEHGSAWEEEEERLESERSEEVSNPGTSDSGPDGGEPIATKPLRPKHLASGRMRAGGRASLQGTFGVACAAAGIGQSSPQRANPGVRPRFSQDNQGPPSAQSELREVLAIAQEADRSSGYEGRRDARISHEAEEEARRMSQQLAAEDEVQKERSAARVRSKMHKGGYSAESQGRVRGRGGRKLVVSSSDGDE